MELKPLSIKDAFALYGLLAPHLPEADEETLVLDYVKSIVDSALEKNPNDFGDALVLMTGMANEELAKIDGVEVVKLFIDGLVVNQITSLRNFVQQIGLNYGG